MATLGPGGPVVSRIGLGLAALGRPAYITGGRGGDLPDRSVAGLRVQSHTVLDAAYAAGIRYADAARSYGRAEEFLGGWLAARDHPDVVVGSKWGYRYVGDWRLDADRHEIKEHSLAMFTAQLAESRALLGDRIALYQVHSLTADSGLFEDRELLSALARLRAGGVQVGLSTSGPGQADTIRRALPLTVDGLPLFGAAQVTWNLLEPSVGPAAAEAASAGWAILIKEAVANGRLAPGETWPGAWMAWPRSTAYPRTPSPSPPRWPTSGRRWCCPARSPPPSCGRIWPRSMSATSRRWTWPNRPVPTGPPGPPGPGPDRAQRLPAARPAASEPWLPLDGALSWAYVSLNGVRLCRTDLT